MKTSIKNTVRFVVIGFLLSLLAGCASTRSNSHLQPMLSANDYLQLSATAQGSEKQTYLLKAAKRLVRDQQLAQAKNILNRTQENLPPNLMIEKQLINASLFIAYKQNNNAITLLQSMGNDHASWTNENQITWYQLAAKANANQGNLIASILESSQLTPLLTPEAAKANLLNIWQNIQALSTSHIHNLFEQASSPIVRGWLSLTQIINQTDIPTKQLALQLQQWHRQYPNHPATALLPSSSRQLRNVSSTQPRHIALLLPLKGKYAKAGNAIRKGFFAAYYYAKQRGQSTPTLNIIDTSNKNIVTAYQDAVQNGADFVVGPLVKNNIKTLTDSTKLTVPTLALNSFPNNKERRVKNLFLFSLSPRNEAEQVATKAWYSHHGKALVITPKTSWGRQIGSAFTKTFKNLGGRIVGVMQYTDQQKLSTEVRQLLNIDQANGRKTTIKKMLRKKMRFVPQRRKDIDMVFLVAPPATARQIRPLLRFYYAGNIPVYATSTIYTGTPNPSRDHDLNGILFCDMPWVLKAQDLQPNALNTIQHRIQKTWPTAYQYRPKLFALGVDAYSVISELNKMAALPQFGIHAATGTLYLTKNHHIYRELTWSKIINGRPKKQA